VDLGIAGDPPKEINVRLKGSQRLLSSTNPEQVRVQINLSKAHQGMNQIQLCEADILTPSGINVTYFYPRSVRIYLSPVSNSIKK
jgi:YbbR domain-containing protein